MLRITEVISSFVRRLYMLRKSLDQNELNGLYIFNRAYTKS